MKFSETLTTPRLLIIFAIAGIISPCLYILTHGTVLTGDATHYLEIAHNLLAGNGYRTWDAGYVTAWSPLFPLLLALMAGLSSLTPLEGTGIVNLTAFGLTIFILGKWLSQRLESRFLIVLGLLAVIFSTTLTDLVVRVMSESVFILLITISLFQVDKFINKGKYSSLLWAAIFTALVLLTRYHGITLAFTIAFLLMARRNVALRKKIRHVTAFSLIAGVPIGAWITKNYLYSQSFTGGRHLLETPALLSSLQENLRLAFEILTGWQILPILLAAVLLACGLFRCWRTAQRHHWNFARINGVFALVYLVFKLTALTILENTPLDDRYLSPVYIPLVCLTVFMLDRLLSYLRKLPTSPTKNPPTPMLRGRGNSFISIVLIATLSLWVGATGIDYGYKTFVLIDGPAPFATVKFWNESPTIQYLNTHPAKGRVFNNFPKVMRLFYNNADSSKGIGSWHKKDYITSSLHRLMESGDYLVFSYIHHSVHPFDYNAADLRGLPRLVPVAELTDGVIFRKADRYLTENLEARHRQTYERVVSRKRIVHSRFDVYLNTDENTLSYTKNPCDSADTKAKIFLHIAPVNTSDLLEDRVQHGFNNLDFYFWKSRAQGITFDGKCMATISLPEYAIDYIRTGQYNDQGELWSAIWRPQSTDQ